MTDWPRVKGQQTINYHQLGDCLQLQLEMQYQYRNEKRNTHMYIMTNVQNPFQ